MSKTSRFCFFLGVMVSGLIPSACRSTLERPNIVLIVTDDQGYGDLGVTGNTVVETPHIDALASQSAVMTQFYVSPVCTPTRASLMTGRYNYRTRAIDTYVGRAMMDPEEVTLAEVLREAGYATGIFGKWHLGDCFPMRAVDQGFEEALVHRGGGLAQPSEPLENRRRYTNPILWHNGRAVQSRGYCTDVYFESALQFIEGAHVEKRPFFVYLPTNAPHGPYHDVPEELLEKIASKDLSTVILDDNGGNREAVERVARIFAMIENVDLNVGKLMGRLDELGLRKNTLVLFMVDNGPNTRRYVGPFRGMKGEVYEGGIRSPFFLHWPARLGPENRSDQIAAHIDVMPTLLEAARVDPPARVKMDGRSFLPLLEGRNVQWTPRTLYLQWHRGEEPEPFRHFAARSARWKLLSQTEGAFELYDIPEDPGEELDLSARYPEVVEQMRQDYLEWFQDVSASRPDNYAKPRIVVASDHEPETALTRQDWLRTEGEGWGTQGLWKLQAARAAAFRVRVIVEPPRPGCTVELQVGGSSWSGDCDPGGGGAELPRVELPPGPTDLRAVVREGARQQGPYQVILHRQ